MITSYIKVGDKSGVERFRREESTIYENFDNGGSTVVLRTPYSTNHNPTLACGNMVGSIERHQNFLSRSPSEQVSYTRLYF